VALWSYEAKQLMKSQNGSQNGRTVIKTMFYINYELAMRLPSEGALTLNRSRPRERGHSIVPSLGVSVGSVFACHLDVGP
jgi:hypothetical protein